MSWFVVGIGCDGVHLKLLFLGGAGLVTETHSLYDVVVRSGVL